MLPDYFKSNINLFIALAPIVRIDHTSNALLTFVAKFTDQLNWAVQTFGIWDLAKDNANPAYTQFCRIVPDFCILLDEGFINWNGEVDNRERMPDMLAHSGGTCWKNYIHYAQIIRDKRF